MGKRRSDVQHKKVAANFTKIVKLSYLQSLALHAGVGDISSLNVTSGAIGHGIEASEKNKSETRKVSTNIKFLDDILSELYASGSNKKLYYSSIAIQEKGWELVKQWVQPEFDIIRYAIGIRNLTIAQFTYETVSEVVSKPWVSPKDIQKVTLLVDQFIPSQFPPGPSYIEYYVRPEIEDNEWIRINPVGTSSQFTADGSIVPRIISFNTEQPVNAKLEEAYVSTSLPVKSVRFRAVLRRPTDLDGAESYSPVLKSYRLLLHPRGGL